MASTNVPEEIIEKKASSPIATACLVTAALALFGAICFQVSEVAEYRKGALAFGDQPRPGEMKASKDIKAFQTDVQTIVQQKAAGEAPAEGEATTEDGATDTDGAKGGAKDSKKAEDAKDAESDAGATTGADADAEAKEKPAAEEGAAEESKDTKAETPESPEEK
jgi:hypothetical protein